MDHLYNIATGCSVGAPTAADAPAGYPGYAMNCIVLSELNRNGG
jgi:hypothetical protein